MASDIALSRDPFRAFQGSLVSIATGLRTECSSLLDLTPLAVGKNALRMTSRSLPSVSAIISTIGPFAVMGYGLYIYVWQGLSIGSGLQWICSKFLASITIPSTHPLNKQVVSFLAEHTQITRGRALTLHHRNMTGAMGMGNVTPQQDSLHFVPTVESAWFRFGGAWLRFDRKQPHFELKSIDDDTPAKTLQSVDSDVVISCISPLGNPKAVKDFLQQVKTAGQGDSTILVFRFNQHSNHWESCIARPARNLDSVSMDVEKKRSITEDVAKYLRPETKSWYAQRGIPYRRGFLFYGPPGTGKSSFATAMAGHFKLNLYILSCSSSSLDDDLLEELFEFLPERCVVLLEDVDSAGIQRASTKDGIKETAQKVTLSGLLNAIDGVTSAEGRVLILTSNAPDALDPALLRPGRIDRKIHFGNASRYVANQLFVYIFTDADGTPIPSDSELEYPHTLQELAEIFAAKVPKDRLTPAEIQSFLLLHRDNPKQAIELVEAWAEETISNKAIRRNVSDFEGQVIIEKDEDTAVIGDTDDKQDTIGGAHDFLPHFNRTVNSLVSRQMVHQLARNSRRQVTYSAMQRAAGHW